MSPSAKEFWKIQDAMDRLHASIQALVAYANTLDWPIRNVDITIRVSQTPTGEAEFIGATFAPMHLGEMDPCD